jgi:hypothetical protein
MGWGDVDWMQLASDTDQWRALVNTVMNLSCSIEGGEFLTSLMTISSTELGRSPGAMQTAKINVRKIKKVSKKTSSFFPFPPRIVVAQITTLPWANFLFQFVYKLN